MDAAVTHRQWTTPAPPTDAPPHPRRLREVLDRELDALYRFVLYRVRHDRAAAEDILQETCLISASKPLPPTDEACAAWLRGVARNLVRKHWRDRRRLDDASLHKTTAARRQLLDRLEGDLLPDAQLVRREELDQLRLAVSALSASDQHLIIAFYHQNQTRAGIAAELGVTAKSVEARLYRARQRLRHRLSELERLEP